MTGSCRVYVTWDVRAGLSEIVNHVEWIWHEMCRRLSEIPSHNEQSTLLFGSYMYTKLQTQCHTYCCQGWLNSLSHTLLHSHCGYVGVLVVPVLIHASYLGCCVFFFFFFLAQSLCPRCTAAISLLCKPWKPPPPVCLDVPTFTTRCLHVLHDARDPSSERWNFVGENDPVILPKCQLPHYI